VLSNNYVGMICTIMTVCTITDETSCRSLLQRHWQKTDYLCHELLRCCCICHCLCVVNIVQYSIQAHRLELGSQSVGSQSSSDLVITTTEGRHCLLPSHHTAPVLFGQYQINGYRLMTEACV